MGCSGRGIGRVGHKYIYDRIFGDFPDRIAVYTPYIYGQFVISLTEYDRIFGDFPDKVGVYTPYIYGQPYALAKQGNIE
jgi:hypothetical protein